jgi:pimeloyl-ACP methyl ester carboxylesterase
MAACTSLEGGRQIALSVGAERFAALELGEGERPCVYLHGFPDHPPSAVPFLAELAARGHRVLAPWLRGYRPSPITGRFDLAALAADVVAVIDRWVGATRVDVIGHDWGAAIAYELCTAAPDRIARAVTLALPHPLTFLRQLRAAAQARRSWYMALFQLPGAGRIARAGELALIDRLWRTWSPGFELDPERRAALHACIGESLPAPLAYYRAIARPRTILHALQQMARTIATPVLQLHGADDGCVAPPTRDGANRFFTGPHRLDVIAGVGHFLHLERPTAIAATASAWLTA